MKILCIAAAAALLQVATIFSHVAAPEAAPQDPAQKYLELREAGKRSRVGLAAVPNAAPPNYQLELEIKRGGKTARYKLALNGGSVSAELNDKTADPSMMPDE